jgi:hypothetical protein
VSDYYNVLYVTLAPVEDRRPGTDRLQQECNSAGMEGWRLVEAVPDLDANTTRGIWLFFASGDAASTEEVRAAEQILEEAAPQQASARDDDSARRTSPA